MPSLQPMCRGLSSWPASKLFKWRSTSGNTSEFPIIHLRCGWCPKEKGLAQHTIAGSGWHLEQRCTTARMNVSRFFGFTLSKFRPMLSQNSVTNRPMHGTDIVGQLGSDLLDVMTLISETLILAYGGEHGEIIAPRDGLLGRHEKLRL
jgi:hypothetical protein